MYDRNLNLFLENTTTEMHYVDAPDEQHAVERFDEEHEKAWLMNDACSGIPVPKQQEKVVDLVPITLMTVKTIQNQESRKLLRCLVDSGGSHTMIHSSCLPPGRSGTERLPWSRPCLPPVISPRTRGRPRFRHFA